MQYRSFPLIPDEKISVLGLGLMRLPLQSENQSDIDYSQTKQLIQQAINEGVNYFDTARPYHGGNSEKVFGSILAELNARHSVYIADKMPMWEVETHQDMLDLFNKQLENLKTDYIDFYLLHAMNKERWEKFKALDGESFISQMKAEGKIRHIGFSFHDTPEVFKTIADGFPQWEFCQLQYNYFDVKQLRTDECAAYAAERNLGIVVMEPLHGGLLANPPRQIIALFAHAQKPRMPAEWGLRWVWENQQVVCALSGMNSSAQLTMNTATATAAKPNSLPQSQLDIVEKAADWFCKRVKVPCTGCSYCVPCPKQVAIPAIFSAWNQLSLNGQLEGENKPVSATYKELKKGGHDASKCVACRLCEQKCPQHIAIPDFLAQAKSALDI